MLSFKVNELVTSLCKKELVIKLKEIFDYFTNKGDYDIFCEIIENYILDDYSRATNETVKIICEDDEEVEITLFQFLINLYFLEFNFMYKIPITRDWMQDIDVNFLKDYHKNLEKICQEKIYPIIEKKKINSEECFSFILSHITERMEQLSELLSTISSPTISIIDLIEFCGRNKEFDNLLNTTLDDTKSSAQLEAQLKEDGQKLFDIILKDENSCLFPFVQSNCLSVLQLTQMFIAVGPRMSINNIVLPHIMKRSYLNGLQNVGDQIAESELAAKALIYKKKFVGVSGYMSRETNLAGLNNRIDYKMNDCGTKHYINYEVKTPKHLDLIISKNIIMNNGKLKQVTKNDTDLIGTTVKLRSICTCAHPVKGLVCKACYGNPPEFKSSYRIGGATSTEVENKLSNAVMAVKHAAGTKTKEFDDEVLLSIFTNDENRLVLKRLEDPENTSIIFDKEYIEDIIDRVRNDEYDDYDDYDEEEEDDDDDDEGSTRVVSKMLVDLKIVTKKIDANGDPYEDEYIVKLDGSFLTLSEDMLSGNNLKAIDIPIDSDVAELKLSNIKPGTPIFNIKYITAETSKYLKELKNIIERSKPNWYINDLDTPLNDFADLVIEAGLKNEEMVFLEPIIYALTRDQNNILKHPDFSKDNPEFMVINLKTAIFKGDLLSALVYQEVSKTCKDIDSFEREGIGDGIHDSSFKTTVRHDFSYMKKALKKAKFI